MHNRTVAIPIIRFTREFTASSSTPVKVDYEPLEPISFQHIPKAWALQVTGYDAAGAVVASSAWDVLLVGSLDDAAFNETSKILENVSGTQQNGDVVFSGASSFPTNYAAVICKTLTLGMTCTRIVVSVLGVF